MTEKRYTIFGEWHKDCVIDEIRDNTGEYVTIGKVVDLLNENEQLKKLLEYNGEEANDYEEIDWANEWDNIVDLLNTQHETIQNLNQRIDDYLTEVNYQLEQGTDFKDTYVRYSRFKQILEELKGELE